LTFVVQGDGEEDIDDARELRVGLKRSRFQDSTLGFWATDG